MHNQGAQKVNMNIASAIKGDYHVEWNLEECDTLLLRCIRLHLQQRKKTTRKESSKKNGKKIVNIFHPTFFID